MAWEKAHEVWEEFAGQLGGEFVCVDDFGGNPFFKITAKFEHWTFRLDSRGYGNDYSMGTRMRVCYVSRDAFRFSIHRAGVIAHLAELLGMQDVQTGDESFDKHFVIRASSEPQVRKLFSSDALRMLIEAQPRYIRLEARDQDQERPSLLPTNVDQLQFWDALFIKDLQQLRGLFDLFRGVLQRLLEMGSITAVDPQIDY